MLPVLPEYHSYEIMTKMRFLRMDLPDLQIITQGGGKLSEDLFKSLALYAQEKGKSSYQPTVRLSVVLVWHICRLNMQ